MQFMKSVLRYWFARSAWKKILIALLLGIAAGFVFRKHALILQPIGSLFIRAIHMIVVPVVFFAIVNAIISMTDLQKMRRISMKAIVVYAACMLIAATIGIIVTTLISPGHGLALANVATIHPSLPKTMSLSNFIVSIIPDNAVSAFNEGNIMQILVFALIFGMATNLSKEKAEPVISLFKAFFNIVMKLAGIVMAFAPYGILALIACVVGQYGLKALIPLIKFVFSVYIGCLVLWIFYGIVAALTLQISPLRFFKLIINPMLVAFTTSSSAATLPTTLQTAKNNLAITPEIANFLLPLGTSLNLNGLSIYLSAAAIFAANVYGIHLGVGQYSLIVLMIVLTAMGAAAVPGSALIVMGAVQSSVGIPLGTIPLLAGVDRLNDMMQTCTNVIGDLFATAIIAKSEHQIDADTGK